MRDNRTLSRVRRQAGQAALWEGVLQGTPRGEPREEHPGQRECMPEAGEARGAQAAEGSQRQAGSVLEASAQDLGFASEGLGRGTAPSRVEARWQP